MTEYIGQHYVELDGERLYFDSPRDAYRFYEQWGGDALGVDYNP